MKKIISMILVVLACAALFAGCKANKPTQVNVIPTATPASDAAATLPPEGQDIAKATVDPNIAAQQSRSSILYWDAVRVGGGTEEQLTYKIFTDYDELIKEVPAAAELTEHYTKDAFEKMFVIAVFRTVRTGGFSFTLNKAEIKNGAAVIDIGENTPTASAIVTTAFETHCILIGVSSKEYQEGFTCEVLINQNKAGSKASHK